jgi:sulfur carrier protein ThiS
MKVTVRLYGTWRQRFPGYEPLKGLEVELPEAATVRDLVTLLEIPKAGEVVVIAEGRALKPSDRVRPGVPVNVMQTVGGG